MPSMNYRAESSLEITSSKGVLTSENAKCRRRSSAGTHFITATRHNIRCNFHMQALLGTEPQLVQLLHLTKYTAVHLLSTRASGSFCTVQRYPTVFGLGENIFGDVNRKQATDELRKFAFRVSNRAHFHFLASYGRGFAKRPIARRENIIAEMSIKHASYLEEKTTFQRTESCLWPSHEAIPSH